MGNLTFDSCLIFVFDLNLFDMYNEKVTIATL